MAFILVVFVMALAGISAAQEVKAPVHSSFASIDLGSAWYIYAARFAKQWRSALPKGSTIDILPFAGGIGNALLLDKRDADLGFLLGTGGRFQRNKQLIGQYSTFSRKNQKIGFKTIMDATIEGRGIYNG